MKALQTYITFEGTLKELIALFEGLEPLNLALISLKVKSC